MIKLKDILHLFKHNQSIINVCEPQLGNSYIYDFYKNIIDKGLKKYGDYEVISIKHTANDIKIYIKR